MADSSVFDLEDGDSENYEPQPLRTKKASVPKAAPKKAAVAPKKATTTKKRPADDDDDLDTDGDLSGTPPASKKVKKAPAPKKTGGKTKPLKALENLNDDLDDDDEANDAKPVEKKTASETYQKITQEDHIKKRPDTYIGSIERTDKMMWIHDETTDTMVWRNVSYVPGLFKIFDEIMVNAADNKVRDPSMTQIKVTIDRDTNVISVMNNGRGLPIEIHKKEKVYIPQMIFGMLLTSSNYDDDEKKVTGGRNGFGAKLCNIFSKEFILETADKASKQKYKQVWKSNMAVCGAPKITTSSKAEEYTKITFQADYERFGMVGIDDDFEALVRRRVYDIAGSVRGLKVFLNDVQIKVKDFKDFMQMHVAAIHREKYGDDPEAKKPDIIYEKVNDRWEVGFAVSDGSFQQVSFVNSIATTSGGTHVAYVGDLIGNRILADLKKKKDKGLAALKLAQVRTHFFLFVNCLIENPAFTSQTKEQLTTKSSAFGSECTLSDAFYKKLANTDLLNSVMDLARMKADLTLKKTDGSRRARINNPKLVDANKAGTKDGWQCTLILTEGDSAKSLAISGMEVVGRDLFGVFPLRGKLLNVRDASLDQIANNAEIQNIKQILGLQHKKTYEDARSLRYGHLMIMTDQDHDGSHIKGLLINFLEAQYPSLLRIPGFLIEFITPIVKVYKGSIMKPTKTKAFFTIPEYEHWKTNNTEKGWQHKYYKGLGTSTGVEAKGYFSDLDKHLKEFHAMQAEERGLIEMVFSKKKTEERKEWLRLFKPGTYLDHNMEKISYDDFVNKELILFSMADNIRSIPSVIDGLKPGQRKVLFGCFKRKLSKEVKVVQLAGYVSEHTAYQHGETSLHSTIVAMAQTFVGSNNLNLLEPIGNFGTRLAGGKDASSPRYISTMLSPLARALFPALDDALLSYNVEDGDKIEPIWYAPVLPLILINGSEGIGTGWSSSIPNFNPEDVARNIRHLMDGEELEMMHPWYRGYAGALERIGPEKYQFTGIVNQVNDTSCEITELPVKMWTQEFKERLDGILKIESKADKKDAKKDKAEKKEAKVEKPWIKDYLDYNSDLRVHFIVEMESKATMDAALKEGLENKFKLTKTVALSNMVAFDAQGRIMRYESIDDILKEFYIVRLKLYQERKNWVLNDMNKILRRLNNQARFIKMIITKELVVSNKKRTALVAELKALKFDIISNKKEAEEAGESELVVDEEEEDDNEEVGDGYNYLLGMAIWSLTREKVDKLLAEVAAKEEEIVELTKLSPKDLWTSDLEAFIVEWQRQLEEEKKRNMSKSALKKSRKVKVAAGKGAAKKLLTGSDGESDEEFEIKTKKKAPPKAAPPKAIHVKAQTSKTVPSLKQTTLFAKKVEAPKKAFKEESPIDFDDLDDDSLAEIAPKKPPARTARAAATQRIVELSDEDEESGFEEEPPAKVPSLKKAATPVKKTVAAPESVDVDDSLVETPAADKSFLTEFDFPSDEDVDIKPKSPKSFFPASMVKGKAGASSTFSKAALAKPAIKPTAKKAVEIDSNDDEDESVVITKRLTKPTPKGMAKPVTKKASVFDSDDENEDVFLEIAKDSKPSKTVAKKIATKPPVTKKEPMKKALPVTKVKAKIVEPDSDDSDVVVSKQTPDEDSDEDMVDSPPPAKTKKPAAKTGPAKRAEVPPSPPAARIRPGRAVAAKISKYKVADSDDDDDDDEEEDASEAEEESVSEDQFDDSD